MNIIGAGGLGREIAFYIGQGEHRFGVEKEYLKDRKIVDLPVFSLEELVTYKDDPTIIAVGTPNLREKLLSRLVTLDFNNFQSFIDPSAIHSRFVSLEEGVIITPYCVLTTNIKIGRFVVINLSCTIGHDAVIEEFVTINPGCNISGGTYIERGVELGTGVKVIPNVRIGRNAIIGAGAVVTKDIPPDCTAVGVPCKPLSPKT